MVWKYREVQIEDDKSIGDSGTETIDINVTEPITALIVRFKVKNTANLEDKPPDPEIDKIEIVDGGETFWSLTGPEAVSAFVHETSKWPNHWYDERAGVNCRIMLPLMFGRYYGDLEYGFVPTRLRNPQLKFQWSKDTGHTTDECTLGVTARVMEGAPPPPKMLCWKEIETFTSAASGVKSVDLPVDWPYRRLMVRAYGAEIFLTSILNHYKMDCDVGKYLPFDLDVSELMDIYRTEFGPYSFRATVLVDNGEKKQAWMGITDLVKILATSGGIILGSYSANWGWYQAFAFNTDGTGLDDQLGEIEVSGYAPHSAWVYQFGKSDDPVTWFPAPDYGEIKLKMTQGEADGACAVAVQQPRTVP